MKAYLDVAAIRAGADAQESNLFQLLERAGPRRTVVREGGSGLYVGKVRGSQMPNVRLCFASVLETPCAVPVRVFDSTWTTVLAGVLGHSVA